MITLMINIKLFECITCLCFQECFCVEPTFLSSGLNCSRDLDVRPLQGINLCLHEKEDLSTHLHTALVP